MSLEALRIQSELAKQNLMQEMMDASPSVWRNVIMTNADGVTMEFNIGNIETVTTGTITTTPTVTWSHPDYPTSWVVTTFQELGADPPTGPDRLDTDFERGRDWLHSDAPDEPRLEEPVISTEDGVFESASPLRDENDTDMLGMESDPGSVIPGSAEAWFRDLRGMDGPEAVAQPEEACAPGCELHIQDDACPQGGPCCDPDHWRNGVHTRPADEDNACWMPF